MLGHSPPIRVMRDFRNSFIATIWGSRLLIIKVWESQPPAGTPMVAVGTSSASIHVTRDLNSELYCLAWDHADDGSPANNWPFRPSWDAAPGQWQSGAHASTLPRQLFCPVSQNFNWHNRAGAGGPVLDLPASGWEQRRRWLFPDRRP